MKAHFRIHAYLTLALGLSVSRCYSQAPTGLPIIDKPRYAIVLDDIKKLDKQIKAVSKVVGAAQASIQSLGAISDGIRDLKGVLSDGVRGLAGDLSAAVGLEGVLGNLRDVQNLYTDTQSLIRDIRALPDEAKYQLKQIGFATKDVQDFLKDGLVYDTFNRLGMDDWKQVAEDPLRALKTGALGEALCRSEEYLTPKEQSAAWRKYVASLSADDVRRLHGVIGPQFAAHLAADWFGDMQKRTAASLDFRNVANALAKVVDGPAGKAPIERDIASDIAVGANVDVLRIKIGAKTSIDDEKAAETIIYAEKERARLLREKNAMQLEDREADAMAGKRDE